MLNNNVPQNIQHLIEQAPSFQVKDLMGMLDLTLLDPDASQAMVQDLLPKSYHVAGVCLFARHHQFLHPLPIGNFRPKRVAVFKNFPDPTTPSIAREELSQKYSTDFSIDEWDMIFHFEDSKGRGPAYLKEICKIVHDGGKKIKVILEASELSEVGVREATDLCIQEGADFVKTSTGMRGGATFEHILWIGETLKGTSMGMKPSGGIKTLEIAQQMTRLAWNYLEKVDSEHFRIGASSLFQVLKNAL